MIYLVVNVREKEGAKKAKLVSITNLWGKFYARMIVVSNFNEYLRLISYIIPSKYILKK